MSLVVIFVFSFSLLEHLGYLFDLIPEHAFFLFYLYVSGVYIECIIVEPWIESLVYRRFIDLLHTSIASLNR